VVAVGIPDLPLVSGHPVLDLVNTVEPRSPGPPERDHLARPADLLAWARRAGVVDGREADAVAGTWADDPAGAERSLRAAVELRESAYAVLTAALAAEPPDVTASGAGAEGAAACLAGHWAAAAGRARLEPGTDAPIRIAVGTRADSLVVDRLAYAAVALLSTVDLRHLRACPVEDGGCGWLFLDRSRNGSRRWCAMGDCGAQAKARRLTARRRAARRGAARVSGED
jgi:predicted RNA-binding Zn ribbon-like protein